MTEGDKQLIKIFPLLSTMPRILLILQTNFFRKHYNMKSKKSLFNILLILFLLCTSCEIKAQNIVQDFQTPNDQLIPLPTGTQNTLKSICSIDSATAFIVGNGGKIIKTSDEGKTWRNLMSGTEKSLESVCFTDSKTGYAAGNNGTIIKTIDGGNSWRRLTSGTEADLKCVYFINAFTGFACGTNGTLITTVNGGLTWSKIYIDSDKWLKDIYFQNATTGYIVGWNGLMMKTTNGGASWLKLETGVENILESVHFINATTGFAVGWGGTIITTADGGSSWDRVELSNEKDLIKICFVDNDNAYCVGMEGTVLKSSDGGKDWDEMYVNAPADFFAVSKLGEAAVLIAGSRGQVLKCVDAEKVKAAELKRYWDDNLDAYDKYNLALEKYNSKNYKSCITDLDSARIMMGSKNKFIEELLIKCYLDDGEFANLKKALPAYDSLKPDKTTDFYKRIDEFNSNVEKYLADEIAWKKAALDTTGAGYDKYVKDHPRGFFRDMAMDEKLWVVAGKSTDPRLFEDYIQKRPYGRYAELARQLALYYKAKNSGEMQPYEDYYRNFPQGIYHKEISDSLRLMYLRSGDLAVINKNADEAERWFRSYEQKFAATDSVNIIKARLEQIPALRRSIMEEQQRMQREQQKNQMMNDLRRERGTRNKKLFKTIAWGTIATAGVLGSVYLLSDGKTSNIWPGIACGAIAGGALIGFIDGWSDVHYYQRHVKNIRRNLNNLTLLPVVNPLDNSYGMVLQFRF